MSTLHAAASWICLCPPRNILQQHDFKVTAKPWVNFLYRACAPETDLINVKWSEVKMPCFPHGKKYLQYFISCFC